MKGDRVGIVLGAPPVEHRRQIGAAAEPALVVTTKRVFICTAGTCGLRRCAISEMPEAQKRGIVGGARNLLAEFRREVAVHGRAVHADLLEQPPAHQRHHAAAAGLAGMVGALQGVRDEAAGRRLDRARPAPRPPAVRRRRRCRRASDSNQALARALRSSITDMSIYGCLILTALPPESAAAPRPMPWPRPSRH